MHWVAKYNIRTNFGHRRQIMSVLRGLTEGIRPCKLDQINADPNRIWHRLAGAKERPSVNCT